MRTRRTLLALTTALVVAIGIIVVGATRTPSPADPDGPGPAQALSGSWLLTSGSVDAHPLELQPDHPVTLTVDNLGGQLSLGGQSACNYYGSHVTVDGSTLTVGGVSSTAMGCAEPVQPLENAYQHGLGLVTDYEQTSSRLVLDGPSVELVFEPLPAIPTAELVDTVWKLESVVTDGLASSVTGEPTLQLRSDGTFDMTSGCGLGLTGEWAEWNGRITFTQSSASGGCQQHPQSRAVLAVSDSFYVAIEGDQLTITGRHGGTLVYRPAPGIE